MLCPKCGSTMTEQGMHGALFDHKALAKGSASSVVIVLLTDLLTGSVGSSFVL